MANVVYLTKLNFVPSSGLLLDVLRLITQKEKCYWLPESEYFYINTDTLYQNNFPTKLYILFCYGNFCLEIIIQVCEILSFKLKKSIDLNIHKQLFMNDRKLF